ncbi:MAG: hypothetical protein GX557_15495 [Chloroflexi bacterium]|nr:hypothetical protein [Chloroflexota bacterium]
MFEPNDLQDAPSAASVPPGLAVDGSAADLDRDGGWAWIATHALAATVAVLELFYYWFALADRYAVFLYEHLGAGPFAPETASRYWMTGLVAGGALLVLYVFANWVSGRLARLVHVTYGPPRWWRVWLVSAVPVATGVIAITTRLNQPVLPAGWAAACAAAALAALALALAPGALAASAPDRLLGLALWSLGLLPALVLLHALERPSTGALSRPTAIGLVAVALLLGTVWLAIGALMRVRRRRAAIGAPALLAAGLAENYMLLPLLHHLVATPAGYRYISSSANFFADQWWIQLACLGVASAQAWGAVWLANRWGRRAAASAVQRAAGASAPHS